MKFNKNGDTIVEVLLATVILSIVLAGAYNLSNRATRINQQAYERTRVSNYLQQQAEIIRASRDAADPIWQDILSTKRTDTVAPLDCKSRVDLTSIESSYSQGFYLINDPDPSNPGFIYAASPRIPAVESLFYIWSEVYGEADGSYVNVRISACWEGIGLQERQQSGVVLRLERSGND